MELQVTCGSPCLTIFAGIRSRLCCRFESVEVGERGRTLMSFASGRILEGAVVCNCQDSTARDRVSFLDQVMVSQKRQAAELGLAPASRLPPEPRQTT